jgi:phosphopantothenoylcysteine decarboxylase/phosphopantothenate--cysteine ligase
MLAALSDATENSDAIIMAAAPADFRPAFAAQQKIKKTEGHNDLTVEMVKNPDIIATLPGGGVRVGFAAETENLAEYARAKLTAKRLDFIVANDVTAEGSGFGTATNQVVIFHSNGESESLPLMEKLAVGHAILDRIARVLRD